MEAGAYRGVLRSRLADYPDVVTASRTYPTAKDYFRRDLPLTT